MADQHRRPHHQIAALTSRQNSIRRTKSMPQYRIRVREEFETDYVVSAATEDEACQKAENLNIDDPGGPNGTVIACVRSCQVIETSA